MASGLCPLARFKEMLRNLRIGAVAGPVAHHRRLIMEAPVVSTGGQDLGRKAWLAGASALRQAHLSLQRSSKQGLLSPRLELEGRPGGWQGLYLGLG